MKLFTTEGTELLEVTVVSTSPEGVVIEGQIMGAMPMKALLTPAELRKVLRLVDFRTMLRIVAMFFRRSGGGGTQRRS
jgi:hypothetical protein